MKIDLLEDLYEDINTQELPLSKKGLRRCIRAIARSRDYLEQGVLGAQRYDKHGQPCGQVTEEQSQFAQKYLNKSYFSEDLRGLSREIRQGVECSSVISLGSLSALYCPSVIFKE